MYGFYTHLPLTPLSITGALCHLSTLKVGISAVSESKRVLVWYVVRVDVQLMQAVQFRGRIEVIAPACVRCIGRIAHGQFWNRSQNSVRTTCAQSGMKREMGHQVAGHILHTVATTEVDACQWTYNLTILIAEWCAPDAQHFVYNRSHKTGKSSLTWNIPPKGVILSDFICTFATSLMILLVVKRRTKVSEKSGMAK